MTRASCVLALVLVLASCAPAFQIFTPDMPILQRGAAGRALALDAKRTITWKGSIQFGRGGRQSASIPARVLVVGEAGVCFASKFRGVHVLNGLRVLQVDPRIANRVIRATDGALVQADGDGAWRIEGMPYQLRRWIQQHLRMLEDARRNFIDLPVPSYETRTPGGWVQLDLAAILTPDEVMSDPRKVPTALVGWRWSELDIADYASKSIQWDSGDWMPWALGEATRLAVERGGLLPGPCPIVGPPTWLLYYARRGR